MENKKSVFETLSAINCNDKTEKKNGLIYLSWAWAWGIVKKEYPNANYKVINFDNKPYLFDENLGYLVKTEVTIELSTIEMHLPIMDSSNKAQKNIAYTYKTKFGEKTCEQATMFDINTAIMRCLTKNLAMFGLGHYIYAGEDITQTEEQNDTKKELKHKEENKPAQNELSKELDEAIEKKLKECKTLADLKVAFTGLNQEYQVKFTKLTNELKSKLS